MKSRSGLPHDIIIRSCGFKSRVLRPFYITTLQCMSVYFGGFGRIIWYSSVAVLNGHWDYWNKMTHWPIGRMMWRVWVTAAWHYRVAALLQTSTVALWPQMFKVSPTNQPKLLSPFLLIFSFSLSWCINYFNKSAKWHCGRHTTIKKTYDNLYEWFMVSGFREKDLRIGKNAQNNSYMYMLCN